MSPPSAILNTRPVRFVASKEPIWVSHEEICHFFVFGANYFRIRGQNEAAGAPVAAMLADSEISDKPGSTITSENTERHSEN